MAHLHKHNIIHRDIKPHNILLSPLHATMDNTSNATSGQSRGLLDLELYSLKISDMGLSKQLNSNADSFTASSSFPRSVTASRHPDVVGTAGWQAPELLLSLNKAGVERGDKAGSDIAQSGDVTEVPDVQKNTQNVDIFSLGCVYYYVLFEGSHPFGSSGYERESNVVQGIYPKSLIGLQTTRPITHHLLSSMMAMVPAARPSVAQVRAHPFFWSNQFKLDFLVDLSDKIEHVPSAGAASVASTTDKVSDQFLHGLTIDTSEDKLIRLLVSRLEAVVIPGYNAMPVFPRLNWSDCLHQEFHHDMHNFRKYDFASVKACLRFIRNKRHHFHELSEHMKKNVLVSLPDGFVWYFEQMFPNLLLHCVVVVCSTVPTSDLLYTSYCSDSAAVFAYQYPSTAPHSTGFIASHSVDVGLGKGLVKTHGTGNNASAKKGSPSAGLASTSTIGLVPSPAGARAWMMSKEQWMSTSVTVPKHLKRSIVGGISTASSAVKTTKSLAGSGSWGSTGSSSSTWLRNQSQSTSTSTQNTTIGASTAVLATPPPPTVHPRLLKATTDPRYRTRMCTHWENSKGVYCPLRKKGKCDFAHGVIELRIGPNPNPTNG